MTLQINMARDFSALPTGRTSAQGAHNAEAFRRNFLVPKLRKNQAVIVDLTGIAGMSASYVQEAFGKLIEEFDLKDLEQRLQIVARDDGSLVAMAWHEIRAAAVDARHMAH